MDTEEERGDTEAVSEPEVQEREMEPGRLCDWCEREAIWRLGDGSACCLRHCYVVLPDLPTILGWPKDEQGGAVKGDEGE